MISLPEAAEEFGAVARVLYDKGWAEASAGNLSLRLLQVPQPMGWLTPDPEKVQRADVDMGGLINDFFLVTASGSRMRDIAAEPEKGLCLIKVLDRNHFWLIEGSARVSSEWPTHAGLYTLFKNARHEERAVVHCHPPNLVILSHLFSSEREMNERLSRMQHETRLFVPEMLGLIPYAASGSQSLADATMEKLRKFRLALWDKHGVIASGRTLNEALDRIEILEKASDIYLRLRSMGVEPEGLSDEQLATARSAFENK